MSDETSSIRTSKSGILARTIGKIFGGKAVEASDKVSVSALYEIFYGEDDSFTTLSDNAVRALPESLRYIYLRVWQAYVSAQEELWKKEFKGKDPSDPTVIAGIHAAASEMSKLKAEKLFKRVENLGIKEAVTASVAEVKWVQDFNPIAPVKLDPARAPLPTLAPPGLVASNPNFGNPAAGVPLNWSDLNSNDLGALILGLGDGLEYDGFSTEEMRIRIFSRKPPPTPQELVTMCATYIFVGNNATKLNDKVRNVAVGRAALTLCNNWGVVMNRTNSKTVTLARVGIAFSPVVWALRNIYERSGKLGNSGVATTTPKILQDVALSGVSQFIPNGAAIEDFLIKFNRVLFKFKEKKDKDKTKEDEVDATARKFFEISKNGATTDPALVSWDFKTKTDQLGIMEFYDMCINKAVGAVGI